MGKSVDYLDVYCAGGPEAIARAVELAEVLVPADRPEHREAEDGGANEGGPDGSGGDHQTRLRRWLGDAHPWISHHPVEQGEQILEELFAPEGEPNQHGQSTSGWPFRLQRFAGRWYVRPAGEVRWREIEDQALEQHVRRRLRNHWLPPTPTRDERRWMPKSDAVRDALLSTVATVGMVGDAMPAWLHAPGEDRFEAMTRSLAAMGPIRPEAVVAFRNGLLDTDEWAEGRVRLLSHAEASGRWFTSSVLDSDFPVDLIPPAPLEPESVGEPRPIVDLQHEPTELLRRLCPTWLEFLDDLSRGDGDWVECLQRFMGYLLVPDTSLQRMLWLQGVPGSGKGTVAGVITAMLGEENVVMTDWRSLGERFELAGWVGKTCAVMPELHVRNDHNSAASLARLKSITGGDPQSVDTKHGAKQSNVRLTARIVCTPNEEPPLGDASGALMRRLVILPLTQSFTGREDYALADKLRAEVPGIRLWALYGLRRLRAAVRIQDNPFPEPASAAGLRRDITHAMSPVRAWVEQACVRGPGHVCTVDSAMAWWERWAEDNGHHAGGKSGLGRKLRAVLSDHERTHRMVSGRRRPVYVGFRPLREDEDAKTAKIFDAAFEELPPAEERAPPPDYDGRFG